MERKAISLLSPNVLTCQCLALSTCLEAECHLGFFLLFFQCVVTSRPVLPPETLGNQIVFSNSAHIQWILTVYKRNNRIHFTSSALLSYAELTGVKNKSPNPHANKSIWTHTDQGCSNNGQTSAGSYGKLPWLRKPLEAMPKAQAVSPLPPCCSSNCTVACLVHSARLDLSFPGELDHIIHPSWHPFSLQSFFSHCQKAC